MRLTTDIDPAGRRPQRGSDTAARGEAGRHCDPCWLTRRPGNRRRRRHGVLQDARGTSAVEFAFIAPILLLLMIGIAKFGLVLNDYLTLTEAVATGARSLALSRGGTTPYTTTVSQLQSAAFNLATGSLTITTRIDGTACATDATCQTALAAATGKAASVVATYPCDLSILGHDFAPSCTLTSSTTEMIE